MSESSSLADGMPSEARIEKTLRDTVEKIFQTGNLEDLTVKRVRAVVERELDLRAGLLKEATWKDWSKALIETEAQRHNEAGHASALESSPAKPTLKSSSTGNNRSKKKRKIVESVEIDEDEEVRRKKRNSRPKSKTERNNHTVQSQGSAKKKTESNVFYQDTSLSSPKAPVNPQKPAAETEADLGDSDLSEVFDEDPKSKRKKSSGSKIKAKPKQRVQATSKDLDPQVEEIKRLQGWLVKCGVRKVWGKELKPFETSREKIKHLKEMLSNVGMTGKYSKEKAESIKEDRELAADLEAVKEGEKLWGKDAEKSSRSRGQRSTENLLSNFDYMDEVSDE